MKKLPYYLLLVLILSDVLIWQELFAHSRETALTVSVLNISQGDAIFIEAPNGNQILVDGGPNKKILSELSKVMSLYDRTIDVLIVTNPDKDHMAGFIDVLKNYSIGAVLEPGTISTTATYRELERTIAEKKVPRRLARRGMDVVLQDGVYLHILFPDRDVSKAKINDGSVVSKLTYGNTSFMLTGDAPKNVEDYLILLDGKNLTSNVLKVGHHGSRTSTGEMFVAVVSPTYAVISAGRNNKYGHPHQETLDNLKAFGVKIFRTDEIGRVTFTSNGKTVSFKQAP